MESHLEDKHRISFIVNDTVKKSTIPMLDDETVQEVLHYHRNVPGYSETPLVKLNGLAEKLGIKGVYVKDESHRFGLNAFKCLGASYAVGKILATELGLDDKKLCYQSLCAPAIKDKINRMTFISATDGNHGRGLAWFVNKLGARSVILMPKGSVSARVAAIRNENSEVIVTDMNYDDAVREANRLAEKNGWILVQDTAWEGYETIPGWITQGYATMAQEIIKQLKEYNEPTPTHLFLQAGVGSMAGSVLGTMVNGLGESSPRTIIVEPENVACIYKSAAVGDGRAHHVGGDHRTMMAGLACGEPNIKTWEILRDYAFGYVSCSDSVAARGMKLLATPFAGDSKIVSGESGAVGIGLLEAIMNEPTGRLQSVFKLDRHSIVLAISSEGDTDPDNYNKVISG